MEFASKVILSYFHLNLVFALHDFTVVRKI